MLKTNNSFSNFYKKKTRLKKKRALKVIFMRPKPLLQQFQLSQPRHFCG